MILIEIYSRLCFSPDAKSGKNPRRRANTMESTSKAIIDKKRRGARKRVELGSIKGSMPGLTDSVTGSQLSITSQDLYQDNEDSLGANFERFRARTQSNLSMPGNSSPHQYVEDFDYPNWMGSTNPTSISSQLGPINPNVNDVSKSP